MGNPSRHRLKQKDLVMNIFGFFSDEYDRTDAGSIWDIVIPINTIIKNLEEKCDVSYKSELWVWKQLKKYEEELGVKLFKKIKSEENKSDFSLIMNFPYINFFQKQHLYVNEKIRVANGVFDVIQEHIRLNGNKEPVKIFLGAGTLCYHLSAILAEKSLHTKTRYQICTNNLGALSQLMAPGINHENILVSIPEGNVDPITHTIVGDNTEFDLSIIFDFIIQGTSCINDGNLFIESHKENVRKKAILKNTKGRKILVLTKHEFSDKTMDGSESYGSIKDYDLIIVPKKNLVSEKEKKYEIIFEQLKKNLLPEILNWKYEIYKIITDKDGPWSI